MIGTTLTLLGLGLVQAATACALVEIDDGRPIGAGRRLPARVRGGFARCSARSRSSSSPWVVLTATAFLIPVAIWLAVRWCLLAPVVELEGASAARRCAAARGSSSGRWFRVASLVGVGAAVALVAGPLLGVR